MKDPKTEEYGGNGGNGGECYTPNCEHELPEGGYEIGNAPPKCKICGMPFQRI